MLSTDILFSPSAGAGTVSCEEEAGGGGRMMGLEAQDGNTKTRCDSLPCTGAGGGLASLADMGRGAHPTCEKSRGGKSSLTRSRDIRCEGCRAVLIARGGPSICLCATAWWWWSTKGC